MTLECRFGHIVGVGIVLSVVLGRQIDLTDVVQVAGGRGLALFHDKGQRIEDRFAAATTHAPLRGLEHRGGDAERRLALGALRKH